LKQADAVTVVSSGLRDRLLSVGIASKKITVIPNGVNQEIFQPRLKQSCREQLSLPKDQKIILFVGRIAEEKGICYLLEAAEKLLKIRRDVLFCLVGDGELRLHLEETSLKKGLLSNVNFLGRRTPADIVLWMGACDIFCLPSIREGHPNVVLEALSCGRPVVASQVGGIPDMVNEENGILVEPKDSEGLFEALCSALQKEWNSIEIRQSVAHYSWEKAARGYYQVTESVLASS
jgi:glycosyltransferase involved in cell wall biosynthesis